eukprot:COSAG02_NODE_2807_length_7985_cov_659.432412_5_plen_174_part_00
MWGGDAGGDLAGYDGKIWSGLLSDYYATIWELLLQAMRIEAAGGQKIDTAALVHEMMAFSVKWVRQTNTYPTSPARDSVGVIEAAKALVAKYAPTAKAVSRQWLAVANTSVAAGFSIPLGTGKIYDTDVGVLSKLCALHPQCVGFEVPSGVLLSNVAEAARSSSASSTLYVHK